MMTMNCDDKCDKKAIDLTTTTSPTPLEETIETNKIISKNKRKVSPPIDTYTLKRVYSDKQYGINFI